MHLPLCVWLTCMHWLLLSATTTLPLLEAEIPCRLVNSPLSLPREPDREIITHSVDVPFDIFTSVSACHIFSSKAQGCQRFGAKILCTVQHHCTVMSIILQRKTRLLPFRNIEVFHYVITVPSELAKTCFNQILAHSERMTLEVTLSLCGRITSKHKSGFV